MNVLIIGSGGRESAFAHAINKSPLLNKLFVCNGNGGTSKIAENVTISELDFEAIANFCSSNSINLVLVGPEVPLVLGIRDYLEKIESLKDLIIIGPNSLGAQLEGSKAFSKEFMLKYNIPTALYKTYDSKNIEESDEFFKVLDPPYVLKADGPASGKGVLILDDLNDAKTELREMILNKKFGESSTKVVIEEFLKGIEVSMFILTDGDSYVMLPEAKDYKRIGNNDTGLNTGGMGAVSPVSFVNKEFEEKVKKEIIEPTLKGLKKENISYKGFIFFGLINCNGQPKVIEYNCRMGDPETEAVLSRISNDFLEMLVACGKNNLSKIKMEISNQVALTLVMASGGYPEAFKKGFEISGLEQRDNALVYEAGTIISDNKTITNGGRVLAITALANSILDARTLAYEKANAINFHNKYFRNDIGLDLI